MASIWMRYAQFITNYAVVIVVAMFLLLGASAAVLLPWHIELDTSADTMQARGNLETKRNDAIELARLETVYDPLAAPPDPSPPTQSVVQDLLLFYYEDKSSRRNVFHPDIFPAVHAFETKLQQLAAYKGFCAKPANATAPGGYLDAHGCLVPTSPVSFLYPVVINATANAFVFDGSGSSMYAPAEQILGILASQPVLRDQFGVIGFGPSSLQSFATKSLFLFGTPTSDPTYDDFDAWAKDELWTFVKDEVKRLEDEAGLTMTYFGSGLTKLETDAIILGDGFLAAASVLLVGAYVYYHIRSLFLTVTGMFHIICALPFALALFTGVLGVDKFHTLNFLGIFIIMGIGADDIFIMVDTWKQSLLDPTIADAGVTGRLAFTTQRGVLAMVLSSSTTAAAFFANAASPIPPIALFGIFTGMLVVINYLLVITWFPAMIVLSERVRRYGFRSLFGKLHVHKARVKAAAAESAKQDSEAARGLVRLPDVTTQPGDSDLEQLGHASLALALSGKGRTADVFFARSYAPFVYRYRWPITLVFLALIGAGVSQAVRLEPARDPAAFLPDHVNLQRALATAEKFDSNAETLQTVHVVFGLAGTDASRANYADPSDRGTLLRDDTFNITSPAAQQHLLDTCAGLRLLPDVRNGEVGCFLEDMDVWLNATQARSLPVPADEFVALLTAFVHYQAETIVLPPKLPSPLPSIPSDFKQQVRFLANGQLSHVQIIANATFDDLIPAAEAEAVYKRFEDFVTARNAVAPPGVDKAYQSARRWVTTRTELVLVQLAYQGMLLSLAVVLVIMLASTRSLTASAVTVVSISGAIACLLAVMVLAGWSIGVIESVLMTIVVGLSVDYVVHFANAYTESNLATRLQRVQDALFTMGTPVMAAAATTLLSTVPLFFTTVTFFLKFGIAIAFTICLSALFSYGFFFSVMSLVGQQRREVRKPVSIVAQAAALRTPLTRPPRAPAAPHAEPASVKLHLHADGDLRPLGAPAPSGHTDHEVLDEDDDYAMFTRRAVQARHQHLASEHEHHGSAAGGAGNDDDDDDAEVHPHLPAAVSVHDFGSLPGLVPHDSKQQLFDEQAPAIPQLAGVVEAGDDDDGDDGDAVAMKAQRSRSRSRSRSSSSKRKRSRSRSG